MPIDIPSDEDPKPEQEHYTIGIIINLLEGVIAYKEQDKEGDTDILLFL